MSSNPGRRKGSRPPYLREVPPAPARGDTTTLEESEDAEFLTGSRATIRLTPNEIEAMLRRDRAEHASNRVERLETSPSPERAAHDHRATVERRHQAQPEEQRPQAGLDEEPAGDDPKTDYAEHAVANIALASSGPTLRPRGSAELDTPPVKVSRRAKSDRPPTAKRHAALREKTRRLGLVGIVGLMLIIAGVTALSGSSRPAVRTPRLPQHGSSPTSAFPTIGVGQLTGVSDVLQRAIHDIEQRQKTLASTKHRRARIRSRSRRPHTTARTHHRSTAPPALAPAPVTTSTPSVASTTSSPAPTVSAPTQNSSSQSSSTSSKPKAFGEGGLLGAGHQG
jgi:hypothetical protein